MASVEVRQDQVSGRAARRDDYEVVVIGGGIAGLTAGALLAHAGKSVLVVEADEKPGGYAYTMRSGGHTFDRAVHLISSCEPQGPFGQGVIDAVLRELGVRDQCEFIRVDPFYMARYPGFELAVPCGTEPFVEAHVRHFPGEARGFRRLAELTREIYREIVASPMSPRWSDLARMPLRARALFRYRNATMKDVIDLELSDPRARTVYATMWPWVGTPPSQTSFLMWGAFMGSWVEDGSYYCRGSYDNLAAAFVSGLEQSGGELLLGTSAVQVLTDDRQVSGVELDNGQRIASRTVISAIDARVTFEELLAPDELPTRFLRRLRALELSPSALAVYVGTDLDAHALGAHHDASIYRGWDHERIYAQSLSGGVPAVFMMVPSLTDPALAPPGEHVVIVQALAARESGETRPDEARIAEQMLQLAEQELPGLRDHLTFIEPAGDPSAPHPKVHRLGPLYGWKLSPAQTFLRRLPPHTPIGGLLLAGHWTQPAHGIFPAVESGIQAARLTLGARTAAPPLPLGLKPRAASGPSQPAGRT